MLDSSFCSYFQKLEKVRARDPEWNWGSTDQVLTLLDSMLNPCLDHVGLRNEVSEYVSGSLVSSDGGF